MFAADGNITVTDDHLRPEWKGKKADITVDHLMRMTSGWVGRPYALGAGHANALSRTRYGELCRRSARNTTRYYRGDSSGSTNIPVGQCSATARMSARTCATRALRRSAWPPATWEPDAPGTPVCSFIVWATPLFDWATIGQFALQDGAGTANNCSPSAGWRSRREVKVATSKKAQIPRAGG